MPIEAVAARVGEIRGSFQNLFPQSTKVTGNDSLPLEHPIGFRNSGSAFASVVADQVSTTPAPSTTAPAITAPLAGDGNVDGGDVLEQAKKYLGVPYVFGGEDANGIDCSGLVQRVFADLGIDVPRVVQDQDTIGQEVGTLANAQPGDLIVNNDASHILFYAGDGMVLHAPKPGDHVKLAPNYLTDADISTIRRVVPAEAAPTSIGGVGAGGGAAPASRTGEDVTALIQLMQAQLTSGALSPAATMQQGLQSMLASMS